MAIHGFNTRAIHVGQSPDPTTGATVPPLYLTSTYTQPELGRHLGYEYGRGDNPTREALEEVLAALEGGLGAVAFASGMAASDAVLRGLKPGDSIVASVDLYGGVYRLLERVYRPQGVTIHYGDLSSDQALQRLIGDGHPQLVWLETPSNPLLTVIDVAQVARMSRAVGARLVVDNTFASPYNQNPLALGADVVVHSTTKYIGGHSDVIGGAVVVRDDSLRQEFRFIRNTAGATLGPFEAWLTLRGVKTLGVRMEQHAHNARRIADFLASHPLVDRVYYPAFEPLYRLGQMKTPGGMISFSLKSQGDALSQAKKMLGGLKLFSLAESLGGVESLAGHPATMTHAAVPRAERERRGITDGLIRLSVGIEDADDLLSDVAGALDALQRP